MSFDIFLCHFKGGAPAEARREAVQDVLHCWRCQGPDRYHFYLIRCPDGVEVEFHARGLEGDEPFERCSFLIRGFSPDLARLIFEVAQAGEMTVLAAMEDAVPIVTQEAQQADLPADLVEMYPEVAVCPTPEALEVLLLRGYGGWRKYRDHVLQKDP